MSTSCMILKMYYCHMVDNLLLYLFYFKYQPVFFYHFKIDCLLNILEYWSTVQARPTETLLLEPNNHNLRKTIEINISILCILKLPLINMTQGLFFFFFL